MNDDDDYDDRILMTISNVNGDNDNGDDNDNET